MTGINTDALTVRGFKSISLFKEPYLLDFYNPEKQLIIETDGGQHNIKKGKSYDTIRTTFLNKLGLSVMRYSDRQILLDIDAVLNGILYIVRDM